MKARVLHRWNVTIAEARAIQIALRERMELHDRFQRLRYVAGADLAFEQSEPITWKHGLKASSGRAIAGVVLYKFPELEEVERVSAVRPLRFPYVPGLLSFREAPTLLAAFARLRHAPDLIFIDGHGYAHPRRFGIASHLGVLLDRPTIGVAKSLLIGTNDEPDAKAGSWAPLLGVNEKKRERNNRRRAPNGGFRSPGIRLARPSNLARKHDSLGDGRGGRLSHTAADARRGSLCRRNQAIESLAPGAARSCEMKQVL